MITRRRRRQRRRTRCSQYFAHGIRQSHTTRRPIKGGPARRATSGATGHQGKDRGTHFRGQRPAHLRRVGQGPNGRGMDRNISAMLASVGTSRRP